MKQKEISAWEEINDDFFCVAKVTTIFFEMTFQGANKLKEFEIFDKPTISSAWSIKVVHKMLRYDFEILYWVWCEINVVDALSQNPKFENKLRVVSVIKVVGIEGINHEVTQNKKL